MTYLGWTEVMTTLKSEGFEVMECLRGSHVCGINATKNGVTRIVAHDGRGWYPAERLTNVIEAGR